MILHQRSEDIETVVTPALLRLQQAVPGSRIEREGGVPFLTVNGRRQVCAIGDHPGYDLWVPRKNPYRSATVIDDMTCNDFSVSLDCAVLFLNDAPMNVVRAMKTETRIGKTSKIIFQEANVFLREISSRLEKR